MNKKKTFQQALVQGASFLWGILRHNLGLKLLALVIALGLWSTLIAQDPTLTREKVFTDVTVNVAGQEAIKRNGFIVTDGLDRIPTVTLEVDVPQTQYANAIPSVYTPRIDLSRITQAGEQEVRVITSNSASYGAVNSVMPDTVTLKVEEYTTRYRIPLVMTQAGEIDEAFFSSAVTIDPPMVAVSGPKSLVNRIVRAEAVLDFSELPQRIGTIRTAIPFVLRDVYGNAVESELLEVTSESVLLDTVIVEQTLYPKKELTLSTAGLVIGTPAVGYEVKEITFSQNVVEIAGNEDSIRMMEDVFTDAEIDVTGLKETISRQIRLRKPSNLVLLSPDTVSVTIKIGPIRTKREFRDVRITLEGGDSRHGYTLKQRSANVMLEGPILWLEALKQSSLSLTVDVESYEAGEYDLPLKVSLADGVEEDFTYDITPALVRVVIKDK